MRTNIGFLTYIYVVFLHLYPRSFRDEFGSEMQADFADALQHAARDGGVAATAFFAREMCDAVGTALAERWKGNSMLSYTEKRVGRVEIVYALIPFCLLVLITVTNALRLFLPQWVGIAIMAFLGISILIGLVRGLPLWSLPYVGLCMGIAGLFSANFMYPILRLLYGLSEAPLWDTILNEGVMWWGWLIVVPVLVLVTAFVGPLRPFYIQVRRDWSVLAFALYGTIPIVLMLTFDEYIGEEWFVTAATGILILGGYFYLRFPGHRQRVAALAIGITLCAGIVVLTKWLILPNQRWGDALTPPTPDTFQGELVRAVATWGWMMGMILGLPAVLDRILTLISPVPFIPSKSESGGTV